MSQSRPEPSKRRRAVCLLLLLALAFGPYIYGSFLYLFSDTLGPHTDDAGTIIALLEQR
jgi:hypothetical protein